VISPLLSKVLHQADVESREDVGVQCEDALGLFNFVYGVDRRSERKLGSRSCVVLVDWLELNPLRIWELLLDLLELGNQRRRGDGLG